MLSVISGTLVPSRYRRLIITAHDLIMVTAALPISVALRENFDPSPQHVIAAAYGSAMLFIIALFVFRATGVQQNMWRYSSPRDLITIARALAIVTAIFVAAMFLIDRLEGIPRSVLVIYWLVAFAGLCSTRFLYIWLVTWIDGRPHGMRAQEPFRVLIIGKIRQSSTVIQSVSMQYAHQAHTVGVISDDCERGRTLLGVEVLGSTERLPQILASLDVTGCYPHVIILDETSKADRGRLLQRLETSAPGLSVIDATAIDQLTGLIESHRSRDRLIDFLPSSGSHLKAKRKIDVVVAFCGLFFLSPLLAIISGLIFVFLGSPIMFVQIRAGRHLREFRLVKFRTMKDPFDHSGEALDDKDRMTRLGSFLRATRLDELPQFWNVLCGDMSLIGPRPLLHRDMPVDMSVLEERYSVRPGITGWAQVNGGHQVINDQKMALDIYYIRNASLFLDIKIIVMTLKMMFFGERIDQDAIRQAKIVTIKQ